MLAGFFASQPRCMSSVDHEGSAQTAFLLLHYSATRKIGYFLRMVAPAVIERAVILYDSYVRDCLSSIIHPRSKPLHMLLNEDCAMASPFNAELRRCWSARTSVGAIARALIVLAALVPAISWFWADIIYSS